MSSDRTFSWLYLRLPRCVAIVTLGTVVAATLALAAQQARQMRHAQITFEQNGFFYGWEQYYVVAPPLIHVYDPVWPERPEAFRHEVFRVVHGKWTKRLRNPTGKPKLFLGEDLCDTDNSLDVPSGPLRKALPPGVRIKDVEHHLDYAIAIYSDTPDQTEWYSLKASLMRKDGAQGWRSAETIYAGDARHYCGGTEFPVFTGLGEESFILLVYTGELSSDNRSFADIQSFLVRKKLSP